jgi:hypothetical protein
LTRLRRPRMGMSNRTTASLRFASIGCAQRRASDFLPLTGPPHGGNAAGTPDRRHSSSDKKLFALPSFADAAALRVRSDRLRSHDRHRGRRRRGRASERSKIMAIIGAFTKLNDGLGCTRGNCPLRTPDTSSESVGARTPCGWRLQFGAVKLPGVLSAA